MDIFNRLSLGMCIVAGCVVGGVVGIVAAKIITVFMEMIPVSI